MDQAGTIFGMLVILFILLLALLWMLLPFLIIGTNKRLDKIIDNLYSIYERLPPRDEQAGEEN